MDIQKILDDYTSKGWMEVESDYNGKNEGKYLLRYRDPGTYDIKYVMINKDGFIEWESIQDEYDNKYEQTRYYENGDIKSKEETLQGYGQFIQKEVKAFDRNGNEVNLFEDFDQLNGSMKISLKDSNGKELTLEELFENKDFEFLQEDIDYDEKVEKFEDGTAKIEKMAEYEGMCYEGSIHYDNKGNIDKKITNIYDDTYLYNYKEEKFEDGNFVSVIEDSSWCKSYGELTNYVHYEDKNNNILTMEYIKNMSDNTCDFNYITVKCEEEKDIFEYVKENSQRVYSHIKNNMGPILEERNKKLIKDYQEDSDYRILNEMEDNVNEKILQCQIDDLQSELENKQKKLAEIEERIDMARSKKQELEKEREEKQNPNIG